MALAYNGGERGIILLAKKDKWRAVA